MKVKTEDAKCTIFNQYIDARALVIRDETIVSSDSEFSRIIVSDKNKVAKDQTVAFTYNSENDLDNDYEFFSNINNDINCDEINNIKLIDSNINNLIRKFNNYGKYEKKINQLIVSREKLIENKFEKKNNEVKKLSRPIFGEIKSEYNGIFSYFTDGFENDLHLSIDLSNIHFDDYLRNKDKGKNTLGKIVTGKKCIILCDKCVELKDIFYLKFGNSSNEIRCKLLKTTDNQSVFESEVNDDLIDLRLENVKIKTGSYKGIKLPKRALHEENGIKGVFVVDKKVLNFKEVDIKHESDDFIICNCDETKENQLQENDMVVVSGRNLYDGKILIN